MNAWLSRNSGPILLVVAASAVVVAAFEILDALAASTPATSTPESAEAELEGIAALAGLMKVTLFLLVGAAGTFGVRRLLDRSTETSAPADQVVDR